MPSVELKAMHRIVQLEQDELNGSMPEKWRNAPPRLAMQRAEPLDKRRDMLAAILAAGREPTMKEWEQLALWRSEADELELSMTRAVEQFKADVAAVKDKRIRALSQPVRST